MTTSDMLRLAAAGVTGGVAGLILLGLALVIIALIAVVIWFFLTVILAVL